MEGSPSQFPSLISYPVGHSHVKLPGVLTHSKFTSQSLGPFVHSSMSAQVNKLAVHSSMSTL